MKKRINRFTITDVDYEDGTCILTVELDLKDLMKTVPMYKLSSTDDGKTIVDVVKQDPPTMTSIIAKLTELLFGETTWKKK